MDCYNLDIAEAATAEGKFYLFEAVDRTSKFTILRPFERQYLEAASQSRSSLHLSLG